MKGIIYCIMTVCVLLSCHDIPEGYLFIEDAGYLPDSMVVKMNLDTASVEAPNPIWTQYYDGEWNDWAYKYYTKEQWREFLYSQNIIYLCAMTKTFKSDLV